MRRAAVGLFVSFALAVPAGTAGQAPVTPRTPPRDAARPAPVGTAVIKGQILSADGRPLRRAQVRASSQDYVEGKTTSSNSRGEYELRELPAGRYTITVTRSGYLSQKFGQRHPGEPGKPVEVDDGATIEKVDFTLPRAGVISGIISDEEGEPVAGVTVLAMLSQYYEGRRRLVPFGGGARTDDTGEYRLLAVPPGDYVVMAILRETWTTRGRDAQVLGYAPSYFPGTSNASDAQRVKVAVGQEVSAVDFALVPGRAVTVSGTITRADGSPIGGADISLTQEITGPTGGSYSSMGETRAAADGTWKLKNVSPGEYRLYGSASDAEHGREETSIAIAARGTDLEGVSLVAGAGATVSGRVVTDDGQPLPAGITRMRVVGQTIGLDARHTAIVSDDSNGSVGADGRFKVKNVTGPAVFFLFGTPRGWAVRTIDVTGRDASIVPIELRAGQQIEGVRIVLTRTFPTFTGRITNERGEPAEGTVLLFPSNAARWIDTVGTTRTARPDQSGTFRFESVRPGPYLVIALEYLQEWQANDPAFLEDLRRRATTVTVSESPIEPLVLVVQK